MSRMEKDIRFFMCRFTRISKLFILNMTVVKTISIDVIM